MRVLRKAEKKAETNPGLKSKLDELESLWGVPPNKLHQHLHELGPQQSAEFIRTQTFQNHSGLLNQLNSVKTLIGSEHNPIIHIGEDELISREQTYGKYEKPEDYLEGFNQYIKGAVNELAAIGAIVNRPRDLTRSELKEVKLLLDSEGFNEAKLTSAWRNQTNQNIAASIVGLFSKPQSENH